MSSTIKCKLCGNLMDGSTCTSKTIIGRNEYNRIPYGIELVIKGVREDTISKVYVLIAMFILMVFIIFLVKWKYAHVVVINLSHVVVD